MTKTFPEGIKTAITIEGIADRHFGVPPIIVRCESVRELRRELRNYLPVRAIPPYAWCLDVVKAHGYINLIKDRGRFRL